MAKQLCYQCGAKPVSKTAKGNPLKYVFTQRPPTDLISKEQASASLGVKAETLLNWSRHGTFPKPVKQGRTILGWRRDEYERWVAKH